MRLQLTKRGDYAIRACVLLSSRPASDRPMPSREIAGRMAIPRAFLPQVLGDLTRAGLVASTSGKLGGYRLARPAETVSLLEVIESVEGPTRSETCVLRNERCTGERCGVHATWSAAQSALLRILSSATLAQIASAPAEPDGEQTGPAGPEGDPR